MHVYGRVLASSVLVSTTSQVLLVQYTDGTLGLYDNNVIVAGWSPDQVASVGVERQATTARRTPTWAIVLAVLGALFFLLGLLFLLVKENYTVEMPVTVLAPRPIA